MTQSTPHIAMRMTRTSHAGDADIEMLAANCTRWKAVHQLARALPDAFVQPAVGTVVTF